MGGGGRAGRRLFLLPDSSCALLLLPQLELLLLSHLPSHNELWAQTMDQSQPFLPEDAFVKHVVMVTRKATRKDRRNGCVTEEQLLGT